MKNRPALFLDRDGVINHNVYYSDTNEWESPRMPEDLQLIEGSLQALKRLSQSYLLFIISNQPSYAKGKTSLENLKMVHNKLISCFEQEEIPIREAFYCFHHPKGIGGNCECRKPSPYFINQAIEKYDIDKQRSIMIGDRDTDLLCAQNAGILFIGILPDHPITEKNQKVSQIGIPSLIHLEKEIKNAI